MHRLSCSNCSEKECTAITQATVYSKEKSLQLVRCVKNANSSRQKYERVE